MAYQMPGSFGENRPQFDQRKVEFFIKEVNYSSNSKMNATREVQVPWNAQILGVIEDNDSKLVRVLFAVINPSEWEAEMTLQQEQQYAELVAQAQAAAELAEQANEETTDDD